MAFVSGKPALIAFDGDRFDQRCPYRGHPAPKDNTDRDTGMGGSRARDRRIGGLRNLRPKWRIPAQVPRKGSRNRFQDPGGSKEGQEQHPPEVVAV